jgi:hypothetical protein
MKLLGSLLFLATLALPLVGGGARSADGWLDDLDAAFAAAEETGKPLLIVFR